MSSVSTGTISYDSVNQNLSLNGNQYLPVGSLTLFVGSSAPAGWFLCQGQLVSVSSYPSLFNVIGTTYGGDGVTNFGLPDLRGRVPIGSGSLNGLGTNYPQGSYGGSENHTLSVGEMPSHTHTGTINANGEHTHTGTIDANGEHTHTGTINSVGDHSHNYQDAYFAENRSLPGNNNYGTAASTDYDNNFIYRTAGGSYSFNPSDIATSNAGAHTHTMANSNAGSHTHTMANSNAGLHTHTMTNSSTGGGGSFSVVQPYVAMSYIIKF